MRTVAALLLLVVLLGFACGCAVGPNYKRPAVNVPPVYRGLAPEDAAKSDARSLADEKWWEVFQDEQLKELVKTALQQLFQKTGVRTRGQFVRIACERSFAPTRSAYVRESTPQVSSGRPAER